MSRKEQEEGRKFRMFASLDGDVVAPSSGYHWCHMILCSLSKHSSHKQ